MDTTTRIDDAVAHSPVSGYQPSSATPSTKNWTQEPAPKSEHAEGPLARTIEQQTAQLPSDTFLWAALGSMAISFGLQLMGKQKASLFIGQWAPSFLLLGVYNKIVKVAGSH